MNRIKKVFLKNDGVFSINGYKDVLFFHDKNCESEFHRSLMIFENLSFMKEYGLSYVYYEVSDLTIIVRDCISEVKQPAKAESRELYFSNHFRRMAEVAEIILNDKKVIFLLNTLLSGGAETSLVKINKILDFYTGSKNISKKLVKKYILALCDTYNFHQTNNVKYFEFLLINKLSTERIIF